MTRRVFRLFGAASFLLFVGSIAAASAGTINLSTGTIDFPSVVIGDGPVGLVGDRGFTFDGRATDSILRAAPCNISPCVPGGTINLGAFVGGGDLRGIGTLDGITYSDVGGPISPAFMSISVDGELIAPPHGSNDTVTLVTPVTFTGDFVHDTGMDRFHEALVANSAIATTTLTFFDFGPQSPTLPGWGVEHLTYDLGASVTPEPSSLLLLGFGVVGLVGGRAWRNRRYSTIATNVQRLH